MERESMEYDVVIVGAGPSGLAAAIRLQQNAQAAGQEISVCVLEKASAVGSHILSGAVMDPRGLDELLPDWQNMGAPVTVPAGEDRFLWLDKNKARKLPTPPTMRNHGNYIISLANLVRWLAEQAEEQYGVEIYPGFAAADLLIGEQGEVQGVLTGDKGLDKEGNPGEQFEPGMEIYARYVLISEGCRGSLSRQLEQRYQLRDQLDKAIYGKDTAQPQSYGIGLKEIWEVEPSKHKPGQITHTIGWPLDGKTYGGSFIYHLDNNQVAVGFVVGLDYQNPHLKPFEEFQRFKTHPAIRPLFEGGKRKSYGARALNEGGWQSIPKVTFPGGVLLGCSAGFLDVPKIKGIHNAIKSGMLAADSVSEAVAADRRHDELLSYPEKLSNSWIWQELYRSRNVRPAFRWGTWGGMALSALDTLVMRGRAPWTLRHQHADHESLKPAAEMPKINYPKPDGKISFDRLSSVFLSNTHHNEHQPAHLTLKDQTVPVQYNLPVYDAPEQRYCPAGVYEIVEQQGESRLQINFANCVHCKTCDIKDPKQNIVWTTPEGGDGPEYSNM